MGKAKKTQNREHQSRTDSKRFKELQAVIGKNNTQKISTKDLGASRRPTIPFCPNDRILLIGEGDFSFAYSLHTYHACTALTATTFETRNTLFAKYPQAAAHINTLELSNQKVLFSIDATKLGLPVPTGGGPAIRKDPWDLIVFNFPHVGGLTKDRNRQVRANQELVVKFLERAKALLAPGASIIVTIFEGEPYSLWNLRDLGRHVGLKVERSFKFDAELYKGYKHARTVGNIQGEGWKGEFKDARTYIFEMGTKNSEKI
ncbi:hypothetical protein MMC26_007814 [Xylographa opegraphella]|nr:hypothetical protein [Xylographa opegraphella]